jgi:hypothetical protein
MSKLSDQVVEQIQNGEMPEDTIHDLHPTDEELERMNRLEEHLDREEDEQLRIQQEAHNRFQENVRWNGVDYYYSDPDVDDLHPDVSVLIHHIRRLQRYQLKQLIAYFALKNLSQMGIEQVVKKAMEDKVLVDDE